VSLIKERRLGKGLEALIPKTLMASGKTIMTLPINEIKENPFQPRKVFDSSAIDVLAQSIKESGLIQPILVRRKDNEYELVAGERRYRACLRLKLDTIPAIIRDLTDKESLQIALIENLHREDLNPIEVAKGYQRLLDEFRMTHDEVAQSFSKSRSGVTNSLRLLQLPDFIQNAVSSAELSEGHARVLAGIHDKAEQDRLFREIQTDRLSVRETESRRSSEKPVSRETSPLPSQFKEWIIATSQKLKTKITHSGTADKGKITLHYSTLSELDAIKSLFT